MPAFSFKRFVACFTDHSSNQTQEAQRSDPCVEICKAKKNPEILIFMGLPDF
ncbi:hypothetical protein PSYMP_22313 [Pseudomonas amygdali pv. morsprunorum str. M302280]|nr:hypothetical protein PSYMP_22313 [Pseudomonas amygdali pv. morsprunorum str. M302280]